MSKNLHVKIFKTVYIHQAIGGDFKGNTGKHQLEEEVGECESLVTILKTEITKCKRSYSLCTLVCDISEDIDHKK